MKLTNLEADVVVEQAPMTPHVLEEPHEATDNTVTGHWVVSCSCGRAWVGPKRTIMAQAHGHVSRNVSLFNAGYPA